MTSATPIQEAQKLVYTGVGVTRRFDPLTDTVAYPSLFDTPKSKWVCAEVWKSTGLDAVVFESIEAAEKYAAKLGVPFICKVRR